MRGKPQKDALDLFCYSQGVLQGRKNILRLLCEIVVATVWR